MRDLRNEMYASSMHPDNDNSFGGTKRIDMTYVTREEFNRTIKELERKIAFLEAKLNSENGWGVK